MKITACSFGFHDWGKWKIMEAKVDGLLVKTPYWIEVQVKTCNKCGLIQHKKI